MCIRDRLCTARTSVLLCFVTSALLGAPEAEFGDDGPSKRAFSCCVTSSAPTVLLLHSPEKTQSVIITTVKPTTSCLLLTTSPLNHPASRRLGPYIATGLYELSCVAMPHSLELWRGRHADQMTIYELEARTDHPKRP